MTSSPDAPRGRPAVATWRPPDLRTIAGGRTDAAPIGPTLEEAAYQRGWDDARAEAAEAHAAALAEARAAVAAAASALERSAAALQVRFTESVHALAVGIAWHLVEREFAANPEYLQQLVARALVLAPLGGPITVRLHPADLEVLRGVDGIMNAVPDTVDLRWTADEAVRRGGCLLEGPTSVVDGRIDRALLDIYERLGSD